MPKPAKVASKCSTVATRASPLPNVVARCVSTTLAAHALTGRHLPRSERWKTMPACGGAGRIVSRTSRPQWRPMPTASTALAKVRWATYLRAFAVPLTRGSAKGAAERDALPFVVIRIPALGSSSSVGAP